MMTIIRITKVAFVLNSISIWQASSSDVKRCSLNPDLEDVGTAVKLAKTLKGSNYFDVTVTFAMQTETNCTIGISFESAPVFEEIGYSKTTMVSETWSFTPTADISIFYLTFTSSSSFPPAGIYSLHFKNNHTIQFYLIKNTNHENMTTILVDPISKEGKGVLEDDPSLGLCLRYEQDVHGVTDLRDSITCSSTRIKRRRDLNEFQGGKTVACNVTSVSLGSDVQFTVAMFEEVNRVWIGCNADHIYISVPVNVKVMQIKRWGSVIMASIFVTLLTIASLVCYLVYKRRMRKYEEKIKFLRPNEPFVLKCSTWPESITRQFTQETEVDYLSVTSSRQDIHKDSDEDWNSDIWPLWMKEAKVTGFPRDVVDYDEKHPLGVGNFGFVFNGFVKYGTAKFEVAIKQNKDDTYVSQNELMEEAQKLAALRDNPYVVNIKGITVEYPSMLKRYSLILTLCTSGNLEKHLRNNKSKMSLEQDLGRMLSWALQISEGMKFIGKKNIIHFDLATRNVLLTHNNEVCKISDFGLSKFQKEIEFDTFEGKVLPIKWLPPDVWCPVNFTNASTATDVWAFGVLLWEILTLGSIPYHKELEKLPHIAYMKHLKPAECLAAFLKSGHRLLSPWVCWGTPVHTKEAQVVYGLMCACWNIDPTKRPGFENISDDLMKLIHPDIQDSVKEKNDMDKETYAHMSKAPSSYDNNEYLNLVRSPETLML